MSDSHVEGLCVALTAKQPHQERVFLVCSGGERVGRHVHRRAGCTPGKPRIALYAGNLQSFGAQRLSFALQASSRR